MPYWESGGWVAGMPWGLADECPGPTEVTALLALRAAMEKACDEALERIARARGKVVSEDVDALRARMAKVDWTGKP